MASKQLSAGLFVLIVAVANLVLFHYPLALFSFENLDYQSVNGLRTLLTLVVIVLSVTLILLFAISLISTRLLKVFCAFAAICSSVALYFIVTYQVILDKTMMGNIFNTRSDESLEFFHPKMVLYIVVFGLIPAYFLLKPKIKRIKRIRTLIYMVAALVLCLATIYINGSTALWFDKHSKKLGGVILPWGYLINTVRVFTERSTDDVEPELLQAPISPNNNNKSLVVLIIGETARANNFSLYGYERNTNPLLSASDAIALQNSKACSTYTTASIHCMLSHSGAQRGSFETLPSYLQRHNVEVMWLSNNWGEPRISVGQYVKSSELLPTCDGEHCKHDEILVMGLAERIEAMSADKLFVVLHTKGSHGPSYNKRYPEKFARFTPVCESVELDKCSKEELINAYDNTIVYTDYVIDQTIKQLQKITDRDTAMLYASDHGESLGEYGLYLHGTPNAIAPPFQLEIPIIVWMSESFKQSNNIEPSHFSRPGYSHENIFHSVMGALGISSDVYNESLDIFKTHQLNSAH